jgi:putative membrane protein (TIGR04086 family)
VGRKILSILAGIGVGMLVIMVFRVVILSYYPFPDELTWQESSDMNIYFNGLPDAAFVMIIASHGLGAFFGTLITSLISRNARFTNGIITGSIIFAIVFVINFTYDFPVLYLMIDTFLTAIAAFAGSAFGKGRKVR